MKFLVGKSVRVSWMQAVKVHTTNSVLISKQIVVPKGGVCWGKQTENNFVLGYVPPPLKRLLSASPAVMVTTAALG